MNIENIKWKKNPFTTNNTSMESINYKFRPGHNDDGKMKVKVQTHELTAAWHQQ